MVFSHVRKPFPFCNLNILDDELEFSLLDSLGDSADDNDFLSRYEPFIVTFRYLTIVYCSCTSSNNLSSGQHSEEEEDLLLLNLQADYYAPENGVVLKDKPKRVRVRRNRKKLPPKSVAHLPAIRILKSDIRRRYAEMVMKVMNNYDVSLMDQFLKDFCAPEFRFTEIIPKLASDKQPPNYIDGLENIIKSWAYCFEIMPDCVFHLSEAKFVRTLGSEGSRVVCKARLTGTKLYHAKNPLIQNLGNNEYSVMQQICAVGNNLQHIHLLPSDESMEEISLDNYHNTIRRMNEVIQLRYVEKPVRVYVEGVFVFYLDQFNRFTEYVACLSSQTLANTISFRNRLQNDCEFYREFNDPDENENRVNSMQ